MKPLISIIIPCYNQAAFLDETLLSVINQTYTNWECIIVNDGSPDNTKEIAESWLKKDNRFSYYEKQNGGLSSARNFGLDRISGEYVQFLDSDDIISNDKLEYSISIFLQKKTDLVISNFNCFYNKSHLIRPFCQLEKINFNLKSILNLWDLNFTIPIHCGIFSKEILRNFKFDSDLKAKEDWLLWIFVFNKTPVVNYINKPFAFYRLHEKSMTKDIALMNRNYELVYHKIKDYVSNSEYENFLMFRLLNYRNENIDLKTNAREFEMLKYNLKSEKFIINLLSNKFFKFVPFKKIGQKYFSSL